ncbi:MAG TPA: alkaline phosphatase family protein [Pyrinomonadaceae bacterium]
MKNIHRRDAETQRRQKQIRGKLFSVKSFSLRLRVSAVQSHLATLLAVIALLFLLPAIGEAQARRLVLVKVDGLPYRLVDRFVRERNPRTGKSQLPWIEHVFYQQGARMENFYTRGLSLSGPSWAILDTGQHAQIKGNVEFDRYTLHAYDYLNFIPFYMENIAQARVDMPGTEVLDQMGTPLLLDAYPYDERYMTFQLYQRGTRWTTLERALKNRFTTRTPRELVDEWTTGFEARNMVQDQLERELLEKLNNPNIRYLDYYTTEFDHRAHHNRDVQSQLVALQELDAVVGRIWTAIQKTQQADETAMVMVSDHGINTDERVYSQGYNLVKLLGSPGGGGHHVITKRRLMLDYSIKGFYPLVPLITTTTNDSYYLKGQSTDYPTALLDFDGNERASIHLRDSDLNVLHILLQQLQSKDLKEPLRSAVKETFFRTIDWRRAEWEDDLAGLNEELGALHRWTVEQQAVIAKQPKKWTKEDSDAGRDQEARRVFARMDSAVGQERGYTEYARTLTNLLALRRESFDASKIKIEDVIAKNGMGDRNSIYEMQNYVVGIAPEGLQIAGDGALDTQKSFKRVNYFSLLHGVSVRNNVQAGLSNYPIDFTVVRIPRAEIATSLTDGLKSDGDPIWISAGDEEQALLLSRTDNDGNLSLRYLPISHLREDAEGKISFEVGNWRAGLPLKIWEDAQLKIPAFASREAWLSDWHTELEWLRALHKTEYSNGLIGLHEQLARHPTEALDVDVTGITSDERLLRRFRLRQRELVEADLLLLANNHWNFDVRGFNPGGNHGSFFRVSTNSTLMMAGGSRTGIPRGAAIEEPYDSLSFMPTLLALTGQIEDERTPVPVLWERGFRNFPGRLIKEVLGAPNGQTPPPVAKGATSAP